MNEEYYLRFPSVLRKALQGGKTQFKENLEKRYEPVDVYHGIKYTATKKIYFMMILNHKQKEIFMDVICLI